VVLTIRFHGSQKINELKYEIGCQTPVSIGSHWARVIQHPPAHHPSTGCLNTGFHRITLGQSDSASTGAPSIHPLDA